MAKYTIDHIIDAGIRAYAKYGEDFTMANVADELGTKPSSLYRHVQNKRELYFAMLIREFDRLNEKIEEYAFTNKDPKEILKFAGSLIFEIGRNDFQLFKLMFLSRPPPSNASPGLFEQQCHPQTIHNILALVKRINPTSDATFAAYSLMSLVIGGAILTSELYNPLNAGILSKSEYSRFHHYLLQLSERLLDL